MTRLLLVRHAAPAGTWGEDDDPGLTDVGRRQALDLVADANEGWPGALVSSPMRRARETAALLGRQLGVDVRVDPRFGEVRTPPEVSATRGAWLRDLLGRRWVDADDGTRAWRADVLEALRGLTVDTAVFTHFVAINVAVGEATGDERAGCCAPGHVSVTELELTDGALGLVRLGAAAATVGRT